MNNTGNFKKNSSSNIESLIRAKKINMSPTSQKVQKKLPYLVKSNFVCMEKPLEDFGKYEHEDAPDEVLAGFRQSRDNYKVQKMKFNDSIAYKNPFAEIDKIKICNSFQLKPQAMRHTIRTLIGEGVQDVRKSDEIQMMLADRLQNHFTNQNIETANSTV